MLTKNKIRKTRVGGKGLRFDPRNRIIVLARKTDPEFFTYGVLGKILEMNKKTAYEIYERDKDRYYIKGKRGV